MLFVCHTNHPAGVAENFPDLPMCANVRFRLPGTRMTLFHVDTFDFMGHKVAKTMNV